jgi:virginiamycin B lyase
MAQPRRGATAFAVAALLVSVESARGQCVTEFATSPGTSPIQITAGPDGNVWFTEFAPDNVARILVSDPNTITEFDVSTEDLRPDGITAGPDGNLWFVEILGNAVGRIEPFAPNTITEFPIPTANSKPQDIVAGPDGNLWFTQGDGQIGRITPGSPNTITEFTVPSGLGASGITVGPDGNLWFAETFVAGNEGGDKIGRILPGFPNTITEFTIPTAGGSPEEITVGPDGNLWFTEVTAGKIGRITPEPPHTITEFPLSNPNGRPFGITAAADGNLWFAEANAGRIGRITPSAPNTITEYTVPAGDITEGPDGNLWYTHLSQIVGRLRLDDCQGCVATKLKAIARSEKARFDCLAKVARTGDAEGLSECVAKVDTRFSTGFAKGGDCGSPQAACEGQVEACVANVAPLLPDVPSRCEAAKLKAVGKLAAAELACATDSARRNRPLDLTCRDRARQRFETAFAKADASGPCSGDATLLRLFVEFFCVESVTAEDSSGRVMAALCR